MESDRIKWNQRYESADSYLGNAASPFLQNLIGRITAEVPGNRALDLACGEGRNSIFLARHGFVVTGLDLSDVGIAKARQWAAQCGVAVDFRVTELEGYALTGPYDLIINFNFLLRPLIPLSIEALVPGGLMIFDSILASPALLASHNPDYLLAPGELQRIFSGFAGEILLSEEIASGDFPTARLLFRKAVEGADLQ